MIELEINGETKTTDATTIAALLDELGFTGQAVAVEVNQHVVPKKQHGETTLKRGDKIELVTLVGGG